MISFNKIKDLLKKEAEKAKGSSSDEDELPPPVQIPPLEPSTVSAHEHEEPTPAVTARPPGDTQELADDEISKQMEGLRRTLEADAFERTKTTTPKEQVPFGNTPPTIEMERPDLGD